jgi:hypothetical protein
MAKRASRSPPRPHPGAASPTPLSVRIAITLLVPCSLWLLHWIGLPGVDASEIPASASTTRVGAFALGITPFISAAWIVEVAALFVPRWSAMRHGGPAGRASLARATAILGVLLALFQALGVAALLRSPALEAYVGPTSTLHVVLTLTAGSACLALLALRAGERALAGGIALLAAGGPLVLAITDRFGRAVPPTLTELSVLAIEVVAVFAATALVLRPPRAAAQAEREPTYRTAETKVAPPIEIPAPASGIAPLGLTAAILALPATLATMGVPMGQLEKHLAEDAVFVPASAVLLSLFTLGLGWLFNQPERVATVRARRAGAARAHDELVLEARAELGPAFARTLLFVGTLLFLGRLARRLGGAPIEPTSIALGAALALDVFAELRARRVTPDLVAVWPEHRPYAIAVAREALAAEGILVHARGEGLRRLLQFFGPYVPIELMVPRADAPRATTILTETLLSRPEEARSSPARASRPIAATGLGASLQGRRGVALALLGAGLAALAIVPRSAPPAHHARPAALQLLIVADDLSFDYPEASLPRGASLLTELVTDSSRNRTTRPFVRLVRGEGESMTDARARLEAWVSQLPILVNHQVLVGKVLEDRDADDPASAEEAGWRTYLVSARAEVSGADLANAEAGEDSASGGAHVTIELTPEAGERFAAVTKANVWRRLAVVIDREVMSAPVIQQAITGGHVQISMGAGPPEQRLAEARQLAAKLRGE